MQIIKDQVTEVIIHPGAGGLDAKDWAQMLHRMYQCWAIRNGRFFAAFSHDNLWSGLRIYGEPADLQHEVGIHRLIRISPFDRKMRRQTCFASVEIEGFDPAATPVRSYTLAPYMRVRSDRNDVETSNAIGVLDGYIEEFLQ